MYSPGENLTRRFSPGGYLWVASATFPHVSTWGKPVRQASVPFPPRIPDFWVAVFLGLEICKNMFMSTDIYNSDLSIWHIRLMRDWYFWEIASADAIHGETLAFTHVTPWGLAVFWSRTVRKPPRGLHGEMLGDPAATVTDSFSPGEYIAFPHVPGPAWALLVRRPPIISPGQNMRKC